MKKKNLFLFKKSLTAEMQLISQKLIFVTWFNFKGDNINVSFVYNILY